MIVNPGQTTATGLASLLEGRLKDDSITRALSEKDYTSRELWLAVKPFVRQVESQDGVLILDDSVEERQYMEENPLICVSMR